VTEIIDWDSMYEYRPHLENEPQLEVVRLDGLFRGSDIQRILDLGCGDGRHVVHFAQRGYTVYGLDIALWGVRRAQEWLVREKLKAELVCGSMVELPWPDKAVDAVVSTQVIYHSRLAGIRKILSEVHRVLRGEGLFFATMLKYPPVGRRLGEFEEIETRTYVRKEGFEKGLPHHFFTEGELRGLLQGFEVLNLETTSSGKYYHVLAQRPGHNTL
jgi:SAM-dependent methyltransferase